MKKKILVIMGMALMFWSCAAQNVFQTPDGNPSIAQKPAGPGPIEQKFKGKSRGEVFEAIKATLAEREYTLKTVDRESGLITAEGKAEAGDESVVPRLTILVFVDAKGVPNVQIEYAQAGQAEEAGKRAAQDLMASLQPLLK